MTTQKERWAAKGARRLAWAEAAEAEADRLNATLTRDWAFISQPGHLPARAREIERADRAIALRCKAKEHRDKARELQRLATAEKGDAERARQTIRDASGFQAGDRVQSVFYGLVEVVRVNAKTCRIRTSSGWETAHDKAHLKPLRKEAA